MRACVDVNHDVNHDAKVALPTCTYIYTRREYGWSLSSRFLCRALIYTARISRVTNGSNEVNYWHCDDEAFVRCKRNERCGFLSFFFSHSLFPSAPLSLSLFLSEDITPRRSFPRVPPPLLSFLPVTIYAFSIRIGSIVWP